MYNPIERKLLEALCEEKIYSKSFPAGEGYQASIERNSSREWDDQGRLRAILDIRHNEGTILEGEAFPIYLSAEIDEEKFVGGVQINWDMPENAWGAAQSNTWPFKPSLKVP